MNNLKSSILNVARYKRILAGQSIPEVSRMTGLSPMTISRIENGNFASGWDKLQTLARHHGITIDTLVRNDFKAILPTLTEVPVAAHKAYSRYAEICALCNEHGLSGEDWVFLKEREKLSGTPYENAVNPNYSDDPDAHFDILTFTEKGEPVFIEVKSTNKNPDTPFQITAAELRKAKECLNDNVHYEIHRVYHIDSPDMVGRFIITAEELFSKFEIIPCEFIVKRRAGL